MFIPREAFLLLCCVAATQIDKDGDTQVCHGPDNACVDSATVMIMKTDATKRAQVGLAEDARGASKMNNQDKTQKLDTMFIIPALHKDKCQQLQLLPVIPGVRYQDGQWAVCRDALHNTKGCVVYAAGARNDISFDKTLATEGCQVHTFDPTLQELHGFEGAKGVEAEAAAAGVKFHNYGWGGEDKTYPQGQVPYQWPGVGYGMQTNDKPWTLKTLHTIMAELAHTHVDVLKMDIEGAEWPFLQDALKHDKSRAMLHEGKVKQILMEVHFMPPKGSPISQSPRHPDDVLPANKKFEAILKDLESMGFVNVWREPNGDFCENIGLLWTGPPQ